MARRLILVTSGMLGLALVAFPARVTAAPYAPPTPKALSALQHHHDTHAWWRVTLDSTRYQVRVHKVDAVGISGLKPMVEGTPVPKAIPWGAISRIEQRESERGSGRMKGAIIGGLAAPTIALLAGLDDPIPLISLFAGAWIGGRVGGVRGERQARWEPVHVSSTAREAPAQIAAATATASDSTNPSLSSPAMHDSARGEPSRDVLAACEKIQPTSLVRVHADFGLFEGSVAHAGPEGLSGLRVSPDAAATITTAPDAVSWQRIQRVELHGNLAATGAIGGALGLGVLGAIIGLADEVATGAAGTGGDTNSVLEGALIGAASGAVLGAAGGAIRYKWRRIYPH